MLKFQIYNNENNDQSKYILKPTILFFLLSISKSSSSWSLIRSKLAFLISNFS